MGEELNNIYEGTEPYLFISYSHQDSERVDPIIRGLQDMGFRLWYDTAIAVGSRWPDTIAEHLQDSNCVVAFISENAMASDYCQEELFFAMDERKPIVAVHLEETTLPPGLRMRLSARQAIYRYRFADDRAFLAQLNKERIVQPTKRLSNLTHGVVSEQSAFTTNTYMEKYLRQYNRVPDHLFINATDTVLQHQRFRDQDLCSWLSCSVKTAHSLIQQMRAIGMIEEIGANFFLTIITEHDWIDFRALIKKAHQSAVPSK